MPEQEAKHNACSSAHFCSASRWSGARLCESVKGWNEAKQIRDYAGMQPKLSIWTRWFNLRCVSPLALRPFFYLTPPPPTSPTKKQKTKTTESTGQLRFYTGQELHQTLNTENAWEVLERAVNWLAPECVDPEQSCVTASLAH